MKRKLLVAIVSLSIVLSVAGCVPDKLPDLNINHGVTPEARETIRQTNETINRINETLGIGPEIGPETRQTIETMRAEIEKFNKTGVLGEDGLLLVNRLVNLLDRGLEIGLDEATIELGESFASIINAQPDKWQQSLTVLIETLDVVGSELSRKMVADLSKLETQVAHDVSGIVDVFGEQARCTVDYSGQQVNQTVASAGGRFVGGLLPFLKSAYGKNLTIATIPGVCVIQPYELELKWRDDGMLVPKENARIIHISGFNFSNENLPTVGIFPENEVSPTVPLTASRETSYRINVDLQGKMFSEVNPGSKLMIKWSDAHPDMTFRKPILIESPTYAVANFTASTTQGEAPLTVRFFDRSSGKPNVHFWAFGDGSTSAENNPIHRFDQVGIYTVTLTVDNVYNKPDTRMMSNFIMVVAPPPPIAKFDAQPLSGQGPLEVTFTDRSTGNPVSRTWDFGDGQSSAAASPSHQYVRDGSRVRQACKPVPLKRNQSGTR